MKFYRKLVKGEENPKCMVCGCDAKKKERNRCWLDTCGERVCSEKLRLLNMTLTKSALSYKEKAIASALAGAATQRKIVIGGRTKAEITVAKIKATMSKVDDGGLSGYTKASRKAAPRVRLSNERSGNWVPMIRKSEFEQYISMVHQAQTQFKIEISKLENFDKRGPAGYHLDHRISKYFGFINKIQPEKIGHICNLQMKFWLENNQKWTKSDLTIEELEEAIDKYNTSKVVV